VGPSVVVQNQDTVFQQVWSEAVVVGVVGAVVVGWWGGGGGGGGSDGVFPRNVSILMYAR
jgi:hypothetical protein